MTTFRSTRRPSVVPITAPSFTTPQRPRVYRKIAYTFIVFTVCLVVAVLWLSSVRANIVVHAKHEDVRFDQKVAFAKDAQAGQLVARVVSASDTMIQEFDVQEAPSSTSGMVTSTESTTISATDDQTIARGTVRVINKYSRSQTLVRTTRLLTSDGKLYRIDARIVVPAGGEVSVPVYADARGSMYAIAPTKFTIPGLWPNLQKFIYAVSDTGFVAEPAGTAPPITKTKTSISPTTGSKRVVTLEAIRTAQDSVQNGLFEQLKKTIASSVQDPKFTDVVYMVNRVERKSNVSPGQSTDKFLASVKMDVTAVYYVKEDALALIRGEMKSRVPEGRELLPLDPGTLALEVAEADAKMGTATVNVKATSSYRITPASPLLQKSLLAGKSKEEALSILRAIDGVERAEITLKPSWISHIPSLQDHIDLTIE